MLGLQQLRPPVEITTPFPQPDVKCNPTFRTERSLHGLYKILKQLVILAKSLGM